MAPYDERVNSQGLYWPNGRNLFRRRLPSAIRVVVWLVFAAAVIVAAWVFLRLW